MSRLSDSIARSYPSLLRSLGDAVLYRADGGKAEPVDRTITWDDDPARMPDGIRAVAWGLASDFVDARKDDLIERSGNTYKIADTPTPDGMGGVTIHLRQTQKTRE